MGGWAQHRPALESPIQFNTFVEPVIKKENNTIDEIELSESVYNLSDRDDVVNKSVIRLIRRFFMFGLKEKFRIVRYRAQDKCIKYFYNSLLLFAYSLLAQAEGVERVHEKVSEYKHLELQYYDSDQMAENLSISLNEDLHKVVRTIGYLVNKKMMEQAEAALGIRKDPKLLEFIKLFEGCCSHYTHKRFKKISMNIYFHGLYKLFYNMIMGQADIDVSGKAKDAQKLAFYNKEAQFFSCMKKFKIMKINPFKYLERLQDIYWDLD